MAQKIAYTMSRFPHLPETFILREMNELERQGWRVVPFPLLRQSENVVHADARKWMERVVDMPFLSPRVLMQNGGAWRRQPLTMARLWAAIIGENASDPHMLVRAVALFPKAVAAAARMEAEGVTHIHAHYATHPALLAWIVHQLTGISYSVTVHAHDIFVHTAMLATKLRAARFIVAISEYNRDYLARVVGPWIREKTHVVHCGISPGRYRLRATAGEQQRLEIINVGSLQPYKGHVHLIRACALLRRRGVPFRCRIVGGGEERTSLERQIGELGLDGAVELLGPLAQEQVADLLPTAGCYVQPSIITPSGKMEGIPVALMEALASGVPVVATKLSGVPELVTDGETGFLVPPADSAALADALAAVYHAPDAARRTAAAGRERVLQEFNLEHNVGKLALLFDRYARRPEAALRADVAPA